jgi:hypothetical protein
LCFATLPAFLSVLCLGYPTEFFFCLSFSTPSVKFSPLPSHPQQNRNSKLIAIQKADKISSHVIVVMSAANDTVTNDTALEKETTNGGGTNPAHPQMSREEEEVARAAAAFGYGPLAQVNTAEARLPAFGGEFQPGLYRPVAERKFANPAPLGLSAFALTTFVLGCINMGARNITSPSLVIGPALGYGGLVQLLAGMW